MVYQLVCTIVALILNSLLMVLIWCKSPMATGKYKWLMLYTAAFEIFWGVFDLPAAIIAHSVGCAFIVFRINQPDAWLSPEQSTWMILIYTAIFGASMAIFASHFVFRYGSIDMTFGKRFTFGWKFYILFAIPLCYAVWWGHVVCTWFWKNPDMDEYTRDLIMEKVSLGIENISYIGAKFWDGSENENEYGKGPTANRDAWIGVFQMFFMVISSMVCVFGFGIKCYLRLSSQLSYASMLANNLQKQLFYALCFQTAIPLVFMHIPITVYFVCPMLNMDLDFASKFVASTITLYPAIDPLPSFFIIKSYRYAILVMIRSIRVVSSSSVIQKMVPSNTVNSVSQTRVAF